MEGVETDNVTKKAQREVIGDCEAPETCSDDQADICEDSERSSR